jgi:hypothetical protein
MNSTGFQTNRRDIQSGPAAVEFEMAYKTRVPMNRIRSAIKHTEQFAPRTDSMREAGLQLLNLLERIETADRRFRRRSLSRRIAVCATDLRNDRQPKTSRKTT